MVEKSRVNKVLGFLLIFLIFAFVTIILLQLSAMVFGPSRQTACTKKACLARFLEGPPAFNDESLREYLRKKHFEESTGPLNLSGESNFDSFMEEALSDIKQHFSNKRGGTFVVLGAGDGEYQDVTLPLERELGWSGLLVEPHPVLYSMLKSKGRKAIISNTCVSPFTYPAITTFGYNSTTPQDSEKDKFQKYRFGKVKQLFDDDTGLESADYQCVPLENLVYAAGIEKELDLLVLDMSGTDLDVLMNVRLDAIAPVEMVLFRSHGISLGADVGGFFLDSNIVVHKALGANAEYVTYLLKKFRSETEL